MEALQSAAPTTLSPLTFKSFLQEELLRRCRVNPSYSLRAFARSLGISHSALTEMLNSKRPITKKMMERLGLKLSLSIAEIQKFQNHESPEANVKSMYQQLTIDQFAIISDWYHYAILELIKIKNFPHSAHDFAKALGITKSEANIAIERLLRIGILQQKEDGRFFEVNNGFATNITGSLGTQGAKKLQKQILEQSIEAMLTLPIEVRSHTSMTMAIDPKLLPQAKEKINKFRRELTEFLESHGEPTEVYHLSLSLFPITQIEQNKGDAE